MRQLLDLYLSLPADRHPDVRHILDLFVCFPFLMISVGVSRYIIPDSLSRAAYFGPDEDSTNHLRHKVGPSEEDAANSCLPEGGKTTAQLCVLICMSPLIVI